MLATYGIKHPRVHCPKITIPRFSCGIARDATAWITVLKANALAAMFVTPQTKLLDFSE